jgi:hypothetical protein
VRARRGAPALWRWLVPIAAGAALAPVLTSPAFSAPAGAGAETGPCGPRAAVAAWLKRDFGETLHLSAVTRGGAVLQIFASPGGTWTAVLLAPTGAACMIEAGDGFETVPAAAARGMRS